VTNYLLQQLLIEYWLLNTRGDEPVWSNRSFSIVLVPQLWVPGFVAGRRMAFYPLTWYTTWILKFVSIHFGPLSSSQTVVQYTHTTGSKLRCQTLIKHTTNISEPLRISVKYNFILPDDGSHTMRNTSEWSLILCLLKIFIQCRF